MLILKKILNAFKKPRRFHRAFWAILWRQDKCSPRVYKCSLQIIFQIFTKTFTKYFNLLPIRKISLNDYTAPTYAAITFQTWGHLLSRPVACEDFCITGMQFLKDTIYLINHIKLFFSTEHTIKIVYIVWMKNRACATTWKPHDNILQQVYVSTTT